MPYPTAVVEIAFSDLPYVSSPAWTNVTSYVRGMSISRGRNDETQNFETGTATVVLDNRDRRFDPFYTAGPYYGNLKPRRQIRIRATVSPTTYDVFRGYIEGWPVELTDANYDSTVTLSCFDALGLLAEEEMPDDPAAQYILSTNPAHFYPLDDPVNITSPANTVLRDLGTIPVALRPGATQRVANADGLSAGMANTSFLLADFQNVIIESPLNTRPASTITYISAWRTIPDPAATTLLLQISAYTACELDYDSSTNTLELRHYDGTNVKLYRNTAVYLDTNVPHHFWVVLPVALADPATVIIDGITQTMSTISTTAFALTMGDNVALTYGKTQHLAVWHGGTAPDASTIYQLSRSQLLESTSARFARIRGYTSFPAALTSTPASPSGTVQEITTGGPPILSELQLVADSEAGNLYVSKNGTVTLTSRGDLFSGRSLTSQATFGSGGIGIGPELRYHYDAETIRNELAVGYTGDGSVEIRDSSSVNEYGAKGGSWSTQLSTVSDASNVGNLVVGFSKDPRIVAEPYEVNVEATNANWATILGLELLDRITLVIPQRTGSNLTVAQILQRIQWDVTPGQWRCYLTGSNRYTNPFILDSSLLGGDDLLT